METLESQTASLTSTAPMTTTTAVVVPISIKEMLARLDGKFPMDEAVIAGGLSTVSQHPHCIISFFIALPKGRKFLSVENFGTSAWTITGRIMALEPDGSEKAYFLKVREFSSCIRALTKQRPLGSLR